MEWKTPSYEEVRMDAEIGSYQEDFDPSRDQPPFVAPTEGESAPKE